MICLVPTNSEVLVKFRAVLKSGVQVKVLGIQEAKNPKKASIVLDGTLTKPLKCPKIQQEFSPPLRFV